MTNIAVYHGEYFPLFMNEKKYFLKSSVKKDDCREYVDDDGKVYPNIFIKNIALDEMDHAFSIKHVIYYQDKWFEVYSPITKRHVDQNSFLLFSSDYEDVGSMALRSKSNLFLLKKLEWQK